MTDTFDIGDILRAVAGAMHYPVIILLIAFLLAAEFGISVERIPLDSIDALALAMCHLQRLRFPSLKGIGKTL